MEIEPKALARFTARCFVVSIESERKEQTFALNAVQAFLKIIRKRMENPNTQEVGECLHQELEPTKEENGYYYYCTLVLVALYVSVSL